MGFDNDKGQLRIAGHCALAAAFFQSKRQLWDKNCLLLWAICGPYLLFRAWKGCFQKAEFAGRYQKGGAVYCVRLFIFRARRLGLRAIWCRTCYLVATRWRFFTRRHRPADYAS